MFWRDAILWLSDATIAFDEIMGAFFLPDTAYQYVWSKLEVHRTLLDDNVRMDAFERAIKKSVDQDVTVLDVGTGTGILAMIAAKQNAKKVYGIDSANIIDIAKKAADKNGIKNVEFIRSDIRDVGIEKVDLIICELLGMYVLDEGITYKVKKALNFLKPGGKVMPESIDIWAVPVMSDKAGVGFWKKIRGIDYTFVDEVPHQIRNYDMRGCTFLCGPHKLASIRLDSGKDPVIKRSGDFIVEVAGEFHGCVLYFDAKLCDGVTLSTDPRRDLTHWKQVFLPASGRNPLAVGEKISYNIRCVMNNTQWRWKFKV